MIGSAPGYTRTSSFPLRSLIAMTATVSATYDGFVSHDGVSIAFRVSGVGQYYLERRFARGSSRSIRDTPTQRIRTNLLARRTAR